MANPSVASAPEVFWTVPEMHGLTTDPPTPIRRIATTTSPTSPGEAVNSGRTTGERVSPPNQTG